MVLVVPWLVLLLLLPLLVLPRMSTMTNLQQHHTLGRGLRRRLGRRHSRLGLLLGLLLSPLLGLALLSPLRVRIVAGRTAVGEPVLWINTLDVTL